MKVPSFDSIFQLIEKLRTRLYLWVAFPILVFAFLYLEYTRSVDNVPMKAVELLPVWLMALLVVFFGISLFYIYRSFHGKLADIRNISDRKPQLEAYYKASMVRFYQLVGGISMSTAAYGLTANLIFAASFIGYIFVISLNNPNIYRLFKHLHLGKESRKQLIEQEF